MSGENNMAKVFYEETVNGETVLRNYTTTANALPFALPVRPGVGKKFWSWPSVANVAQKWRGITESIVKWPVEWEYMRRCPLMFLSSTIRSARKRFPRLQDHLMRLTDSGFSEFNFLGAFVEHVEPEKYCAINTIKFLPPCPAKQFWSWGGITPEIQSEIEGYLQ